MSIRFRTRAAGWGSFALLSFALFSSSSASALCPPSPPTCASLSGGGSSLVYGIGGSAQTPLMKQVALALLPTVTVIYADPSACLGIGAILDDAANPGVQVVSNQADAKYWTAQGDQCSCTLPGSGGGGQVFDFGLMGNSAPLCAGISSLPSYIDDSFGPVSSVSVIVAQGSPETAISSAALAAIYGRPAAFRPSPWTDDATLYKRSATSYVQIYLAQSIGISPSSFYGTAVSPSTNERMAELVGLAGGTANQRASRIGFVSSEVADQFASTVNTLAYQHTDQTCGYWPDSTANARDKINVRNGQYWLWGATHFFTRNDGVNVSPEAQSLVAWLRTAQGDPTTAPIAQPAGSNLLDAIILAGNIPECAMQVSRTTDLGPLASFSPIDSCGCYFEFVATGTTPSSCVRCDGPNPGTNPYTNGECHYGYWEPS